MGAGRTEFLECVIGRHPLASGRLYVEGELVRERDVGGRIARGLALIPEDRQRDGLVAILSVAENLTMASLSKLTRVFHIQSRVEAEAVRREVKNLTIKVADPALPVSSLSGGNQQKVVIGKALLTEPKVLLMDEPSRGIDIGAKADVFRMMRKLAAKGIGIIFVTSDLDEALALSDRIAVMSQGQLTALFDRADAARSQDRRRVFRRPCSRERRRSGRERFHDRRRWTDARPTRGGSLTLNLMRLRTFIALFAVMIFFSFAAPNFLSAANLVLMSKHVALNAFLAIGMTFVIITGGIDLSVGSIVGLCGMVAGGLILHGIDLRFGYTLFFNIPEIILITLALGVLIGMVNGFLITRLNVAPFIATLGTLYVARGAALLISDGSTFPNLEGNPAFGTTGFAFLGAGKIFICRSRSGF